MIVVLLLQALLCIITYIVINGCRIYTIDEKTQQCNLEPVRRSRLALLVYVLFCLLPVAGLADCLLLIVCELSYAHDVVVPRWMSKIKKYWIDDKI